jgi:hypothetical protein
MKYVLLLMLVGSAAFAAVRETSWSPAQLWPQATAAPVEHSGPSATAAVPAAGAALQDLATFVADPHAGLDALGNPHAGPFAGAAGGMGSCTRTRGALAELPAESHVHSPLSPLASNTPAVLRSTAANGRTVAEVFAQRTTLREQRVRVRGTVVKRTDGVLGKTYLHLQDGSGSPTQQDYDLTVTTQDAFEIGETVEVEGQLRIDQDLGVGYRYAALLEAAARVASN